MDEVIQLITQVGFPIAARRAKEGRKANDPVGKVH